MPGIETSKQQTIKTKKISNDEKQLLIIIAAVFSIILLVALIFSISDQTTRENDIVKPPVSKQIPATNENIKTENDITVGDILNEMRKNEKRKEIGKPFLRVDAQKFSDGVISCNLYLIDKNENSFTFENGMLLYYIYDYAGNKILTGSNSDIANVGKALYIDIPVGYSIVNASKIKFIYAPYSGEKVVSERVVIEESNYN